MKQELPKPNNQSSTCAIGIIHNYLITPSTTVERTLQIQLFMQNEPNFPRFSPKNDDYAKKRTQFKANQTQFSPNFKAGKAKTKPNKPNLSSVGFESYLIFFWTIGIGKLKSKKRYK